MMARTRIEVGLVQHDDDRIAQRHNHAYKEIESDKVRRDRNRVLNWDGCAYPTEAVPWAAGSRSARSSAACESYPPARTTARNQKKQAQRQRIERHKSSCQLEAKRSGSRSRASSSYPGVGGVGLEEEAHHIAHARVAEVLPANEKHEQDKSEKQQREHARACRAQQVRTQQHPNKQHAPRNRTRGTQHEQASSWQSRTAHRVRSARKKSGMPTGYRNTKNAATHANDDHLSTDQSIISDDAVHVSKDSNEHGTERCSGCKQRATAWHSLSLEAYDGEVGGEVVNALDGLALEHGEGRRGQPRVHHEEREQRELGEAGPVARAQLCATEMHARST